MTLRLALLSLLIASPAAAQTETTPPDRFATGLEADPPSTPRRGERVDFNLEDGDLMDLVRMMTTITGHRFIINTTRTRQLTATVAAAEPVTRAEAYRAFLAILNLNGLTVVRRGRYHVIVDSEGVARRPLAVTDDERPPPADERFVTWIHRVRHMAVSEASQLLDGLRSTEGAVIPYDPTRTLIVVDTGANIARMRRILATVDLPQSDVHVWVEPIHHANAADLVTHLEAIFESPGDDDEPAARRPARARAQAQAAEAAAPAGPTVRHDPIRFLADERTNTLILIGTDAEYRRAIELLRVLDRPDQEATTSVHVRRLQNADAANVSQTLQSLLQRTSTASASASAGSARASADVRIAGLRGEVGIEPHEDLNAIVITATPADYRLVSQIVDALDVAPRQVFLEMVLMELSVDDQEQLGLDLLGGIANLFGEDLLGVLANTANASATGGAGLLSLLGPTLPGTSQRSFGVELHALAANEQTNVISTPYVLALDNREATINIGEDIPLQGSSVPGLPSVLSQALPQEAQDAANSATALNALSGGGAGGRRNTGTIVTVTPHINDDGEIRLEIEAEDSRAGDRVGNLDASVIRQSLAQTVLVAQDGQPVVIGGMMRDAVTTTQDGVPVLSQIPILGALFGRQTRQTERRNLLFFITPHIIRGPQDLRAIYERRMRERREFLERHMVFESDDYEPTVDYSRTRGLVSEMLDVVGELEREAEARVVAPEPAPEHVPRPPVGEAPDA